VQHHAGSTLHAISRDGCTVAAKLMRNSSTVASADQVVAATRAWLEKAVIGLNLCPFAKTVHVANQIRYAVSNAQTTEALLADLGCELQTLAAADPAQVETTLLIHPRVLDDFLDYNDFLDIADAAVEELGLTGTIQVASFHPQYRFTNTEADAIENYSNRSPYPMLHLLREESVERAVATFPDAGHIPERNIETLRRIGHDGWCRLGLPAPPEPAGKTRK
jgi:hypothetical protein